MATLLQALPEGLPKLPEGLIFAGAERTAHDSPEYLVLSRKSAVHINTIQEAWIDRSHTAYKLYWQELYKSTNVWGRAWHAQGLQDNEEVKGAIEKAVKELGLNDSLVAIHEGFIIVEHIYSIGD